MALKRHSLLSAWVVFLWALLSCALGVNGSSSLSSSSDSFIDTPRLPWQSRMPYDVDEDIKYNNGTVFYERRSPGVIAVPFFTVYWWLAILILILVVTVIYAVLCVWICFHFEKSEQKKAKKVVEAAYVENGFFDLDTYAEESGMALKRSASRSNMSSSSASGVRHRGNKNAKGGRNASNPFAKRGSDTDSVSYHGNSDSDERAFGDEDARNDNYYNSDENAGNSGSDDEWNASNLDISSSESARNGDSAYRMPMGTRRSQNSFSRR